MGNTYYASGQWNYDCQLCGRKRKSGDIRQRWDGLRVCKDTCWETRQPQDFPGEPYDKISVPFANEDPIIFKDE